MGHGLVVACTNGKAAPPVVRLRDVRPSRSSGREAVDRLFRRWTSRLEAETGGHRITARALYSGVAWSASCAAERALGRIGADGSMSVLSAGYGLVRADDDLVPYAATFSPGTSDSVASTVASHSGRNRAWWERLTAWRPRAIRGPRTFVELSETVDALMVVLSPRYLLAAEDDLLRTVRSGAKVVIVSGGLPRTHALASRAVHFDKRLREPEEVTGAPRLIRASDMSLNQRVAEHLIDVLGDAAFDLDAASAYLNEAMANRRSARTYTHREPATDDELIAFIEESLLADGSLTKTRLLNEWRAAGRQCEQKRFGRLFYQATEALELSGLREPRELAL